MIDRRALLLGGLCGAAATGSLLLEPRRRLRLLPDVDLDKVVPAKVGSWISETSENLVAPAEQGTLAAKLYDQNVTRVYVDQQSGFEIMMLLAYGKTQSDKLQLHRPEVCYPAFGYEIAQSEALPLRLTADIVRPARRLLARMTDRHEAIIYWTRLGDFFPTTQQEQRVCRLRTAMQGNVGDGVLARFSSYAPPAVAWSRIEQFVPELLAAMPDTVRPGLVGRRSVA